MNGDKSSEQVARLPHKNFSFSAIPLFPVAPRQATAAPPARRKWSPKQEPYCLPTGSDCLPTGSAYSPNRNHIASRQETATARDAQPRPTHQNRDPNRTDDNFAESFICIRSTLRNHLGFGTILNTYVLHDPSMISQTCVRPAEK